MSIVTILNALLTSVLHQNNPYENLFKQKPYYHFFKAFRCACYPLLRLKNKHKFDFITSIFFFLVTTPNIKVIYAHHLLEKHTSLDTFVMKIFFPIPNNPFTTSTSHNNRTSSHHSPLTVFHQFFC